MGRRTAAILAVLLMSVGLSTAAAASERALYDSMPRPVPGNVPSLGFEATSTSEFGDRIQLADGERRLSKVSVLMSSWACESGSWFAGTCATTKGATFRHAISLRIYAVGPNAAPGALLLATTTTFAMPYRPSADPTRCSGGRWYEQRSGTCFNGKAFTITFKLADRHVVVPGEIIVAIAYDTSHYGAAPLGAQPCSTTTAGCPYDSLNVGLVDPASTLRAGTNPAPNDAYLSSTWSGAYCSPQPTGFFRLDAGCWGGYKPAIRVVAGGDGDDGED